MLLALGCPEVLLWVVTDMRKGHQSNGDVLIANREETAQYGSRSESDEAGL